MFTIVEFERRGVRKCSKCRIVKPLDDMIPCKSSSSGRMSRCRDCAMNIKRASVSSPEGYRRYRDSYLRKTYGMTLPEYEALLAAQGGGCAVCGSTVTDRGALPVDHCHETGRNRGILCSACNKIEGAVREAAAAAGMSFREYVGAVASYMEKWDSAHGCDGGAPKDAPADLAMT